MTPRLVLAYLKHAGSSSVQMIADTLDIDVAAIQAAIADTLLPLSFISASSDEVPVYEITESGAGHLEKAQFDSNGSADLTVSINHTFDGGAEGEASFFQTVANLGFGSGDARDISYLVAEYGIGASLKSGDIGILLRCARLSKLTTMLASRI
jgi:hypothetical protein